MKARGSMPRSLRTLVAVIASAGVAATTGSGLVLAASEVAIQGQITATAVPSGAAPVQLLAGSDGSLWFVTAGSQLGEISSSGQASLTPVTLPHGNVTATLAAAGPEGVWAYGNTLDYTDQTFGCTVTLVQPGGGVLQPALPASTLNHFCADAAADAQGNLWVAFSVERVSYCTCRPGMVAEISPSGKVVIWDLVRPGALPRVVTLGSDGAIWVLEGYVTENIARYTATGPPSPGISTYGRQTGLWSRSDGSFWWEAPRYCSGLPYPICPRVGIITQAGVISLSIILPVTYANFSGDESLSPSPDGSLWMAGYEKDGISRFFRVDGTGTVDRSPAFPSGTSGAALQADGPIAITTDGTAWAVAGDGTATYVVRFAPAPGS